jgi:hypothetical protein
MAKMNPTTKFLLALGVTAAAGLAAKVLYDRCTKAEKKEWRSALPHHGEVGLLALLAGAASGNPLLTGAGLGAVVTDLDDKDEWFN